MKQKIKQLLKIGILTFGISLFIISCSKENVAEIELNETEQLQNKFSLEDFDDVFIKNNIEIDWDNFNTNLNSENEIDAYEYHTHFKVKSSIEDYAKYKLLASKNEFNEWKFEIIKFTTSKENINNDLSYFSVNNFSGSIYHYNLNGDNTLIKVYSKGEITEEISVNDFNNVNTLAKAPPIGGGHCLGCWTLVRTEHYTDWYTNSGGGSTLSYSHSTYDGATMEWVYNPGNGDYLPYDPEDDAYHNHYDYPHGGGNTDNHEDEVVNPFLGADCRSFEYAQPPGALQKGCGVTDFDHRFYSGEMGADGSVSGGYVESHFDIVYFTMPPGMTNGQAANLTATAITAAITATDLYFFNNPNASAEDVGEVFINNIQSSMASYGGQMVPNPPFNIPSPAPYITSFFGASTNCN